MNRKITIPNINDGKEFELPERKVKHTRYILGKTLDSPEKMRGYDISYHTAYIILKEIKPSIEYKDIDELDDKILVDINNIVWGKPDTEDFQVDPAL
jgi:hypothetical protein